MSDDHHVVRAIRADALRDGARDLYDLGGDRYTHAAAYLYGRADQIAARRRPEPARWIGPAIVGYTLGLVSAIAAIAWWAA